MDMNHTRTHTRTHTHTPTHPHRGFRTAKQGLYIHRITGLGCRGPQTHQLHHAGTTQEPHTPQARIAAIAAAAPTFVHSFPCTQGNRAFHSQVMTTLGYCFWVWSMVMMLLLQPLRLWHDYGLWVVVGSWRWRWRCIMHNGIMWAQCCKCYYLVVFLCTYYFIIFSFW